MASSEEYVVVWAGVCRRLRAKEPEGACREARPLMTRAGKVGLRAWVDTFEADQVEGPVYSLLLGRCLATLGYKEGRTSYSLTGNRVAGLLEKIEERLRRSGIQRKPTVHVLVHLEEDDD